MSTREGLQLCKFGFRCLFYFSENQNVLLSSLYYIRGPVLG
jgi:hypothetical protein